MTKEELEKEAETYTKNVLKDCNCNLGNPRVRQINSIDIQDAYLAGAEPREKQIQIDAEQIRALQKQNGELTDELTLTNNECKDMREELKQRVRENQKLCEQIEKGKIVEHFEAYGQCRDSRRIAELEAQIEKMKCCMKCEHWYYYKSFCDKDNSYRSEGQSCEHFILRR